MSVDPDDGVQPDDEVDLLERIADEFVNRCRKGEYPTVSEYERLYPDLADDIRDVFPTMAAMEGLKIKKHREHGSPGVTTQKVERERLGDFRLVREVGRGGMGIVYEAVQESLGRTVAVKVLPPILDQKLLERFKREARTAGRLHHSNIVPVFGAPSSDGYHYLVMQFIDGVGLDALLASEFKTEYGTASPHTAASSFGGFTELSQDSEFGHDDSAKNSASRIDAMDDSPVVDGPSALTVQPVTSIDFNLTFENIADIGIQAANALQYAHDHDTLHRDIKPGNLLLDRDGVLWVADFGLAKAIEGDDLTQTGKIVGTLRYMAPEQFKGRADARSDIFGLGLTLYELLTRKPARPESDRSQLIASATNSVLTSPRKLNPDIPLDLETIVLKAAAREPSHRYQSAGELADDLQRYLADEPIHARRVRFPERAWRWSRRNPLVASLTGAIASLCLLVMVTLAYAQHTANVGKAQAEESAKLAQEALDAVFDRFAPPRSLAPTDLTDPESRGATPIVVHSTMSQGTAEALKSLIDHYEVLAAQDNHQPEINYKIADAFGRIGDVYQRVGRHDLAIEKYKVALARFAKLEDSQSTENLLEQAAIRNEMGSCYRMMGVKKETRDIEFQLAEKLLARIPAKDQESPKYRFQLAQTQYFRSLRLRPGEGPATSAVEPGPIFGRPRRGQNRPGMNMFRGAYPGRPGRQFDDRLDQRSPELKRLSVDDIDRLKQASATLRELADEYPNVGQYKLVQALCLRELESDQDRMLVDAESINILRQLAKDEPKVPEYSLAYLQALLELNVYDRHVADVDYEALASRFDDAVEVARRLVDEFGNLPAYRVAAAHACNKLAVIEEIEAARRDSQGENGRRHLAKAERLYRMAVDLQEPLVRKFPEAISYLLWQANFQDALGRVLRDQQDAEESVLVLEEAIAKLNQRLKEDGDSVELHRWLAALNRNISGSYRRIGDDLYEGLAEEAAEFHDRYVE